MNEEPERRRQANVGVIISIAALALALMIQFGGTIWWGAMLTSNVANIKELLNRMDGERYTKADASRDIARLDQRAGELSDRIRRVEERVDGSRR